MTDTSDITFEDTDKIEITGKFLILHQDSTKEYFNLSEIDKLYECKFNFVKTFFFAAGIIFFGTAAISFLLNGMFKT